MSIIARQDRFRRLIAYGTGSVLGATDNQPYAETILNGKKVVYCKVGLAWRYNREKEKYQYQVAVIWEYASRPFANAIRAVEYQDTVLFQGVIEQYPEISDGAQVAFGKRTGQIHIEMLQVFHCGCPKSFEVNENQIYQRGRGGNEDYADEAEEDIDDEYEF